MLFICIVVAIFVISNIFTYLVTRNNFETDFDPALDDICELNPFIKDQNLTIYSGFCPNKVDSIELDFLENTFNKDNTRISVYDTYVNRNLFLGIADPVDSIASYIFLVDVETGELLWSTYFDTEFNAPRNIVINIERNEVRLFTTTIGQQSQIFVYDLETGELKFESERI